MSQRQDAPESPVRTPEEQLREIQQIVDDCAARKLDVAGRQRWESWEAGWEELNSSRDLHERLRSACVTVLNRCVKSVDPVVRARCLDDLRELTPLLNDIFAWRQPMPDIRGGFLPYCELPDGRREYYVPTNPRLAEAKEHLRALLHTFRLRIGRFIEEWAVWMEPENAGTDGNTGTGKQEPTRAKRSTERGEGHDKLVAALTKHHRYADDGALNLEPASNNGLARQAGVDKATASAFFRKQFGGHGKYKSHYCTDPMRLATALKQLNGEFTPHKLFGGTPPSEADRNDE